MRYFLGLSHYQTKLFDAVSSIKLIEMLSVCPLLEWYILGFEIDLSLVKNCYLLGAPYIYSDEHPYPKNWDTCPGFIGVHDLIYNVRHHFKSVYSV